MAEAMLEGGGKGMNDLKGEALLDLATRWEVPRST